MCDTPDDPPKSSINPINVANKPTYDKDTVDNHQKVKADFEKELLIYIIMHLKNRGLITAKVYENAVNIILKQ